MFSFWNSDYCSTTYKTEWVCITRNCADTFFCNKLWINQVQIYLECLFCSAAIACYVRLESIFSPICLCVYACHLVHNYAAFRKREWVKKNVACFFCVTRNRIVCAVVVDSFCLVCSAQRTPQTRRLDAKWRKKESKLKKLFFFTFTHSEMFTEKCIRVKFIGFRMYWLLMYRLLSALNKYSW